MDAIGGRRHTQCARVTLAYDPIHHAEIADVRESAPLSNRLEPVFRGADGHHMDSRQAREPDAGCLNIADNGDLTAFEIL